MQYGHGSNTLRPCPPFFTTQHVSPGDSPDRRVVSYPVVIFKWSGRSSHPFRSVLHRSNSSCSAASHSLFGPYSPFLPDRVRKSSDWLKPLNINGLSPRGRFQGLWEHSLYSVLSTREFERLVRKSIPPSGLNSDFRLSRQSALASGR